ncbi:hypothetical protein [Zhongshania sp.]|uniref:hypothetical protein n=1 Tax=Zhongshania sp. TaxID=1971902 RepID=UPI0035639E8E
MNKQVSVAVCPSCDSSVPVEGGVWISHEIASGNARYQCVGSGEAPAAGKSEQVIVSDE